jgi:hypothetical protein
MKSGDEIVTFVVVQRSSLDVADIFDTNDSSELKSLPLSDIAG